MAEPVRVPVKKEIWHWALRESQKDEAEFYGRFPQAEKWLKQERNPTFKQLESAAKYLQIPFGYMFLDTPPKENVMEIEFRSISNKIPQISKDLQDTILEMDRRRNWMSDYRKDLGWTKLDIIKDFNEQKSGDIAADAKLAKRLLNLPEYWYTRLKDLDQTFGFLKEKLEHIGILVMRNGIVGNNTRRSLDINEFRAFMLYDDVAPLIFINNNDSKAGKIFSLIHEYFHVLFEQEDVVLDPYVQTTPDEQQINALTAEFLMPQEQIFGLWDRRADVLEQINRLSSYFKVSRLAFAIKLNSLG
ncbi:MAG: ImmA/IrrE family metallo-endopeptidase, partial [Firmicutes bacterium]|nr:ImmA/IrrE family metallo-endopeptidase [Bacillota bacterium]